MIDAMPPTDHPLDLPPANNKVYPEKESTISSPSTTKANAVKRSVSSPQSSSSSSPNSSIILKGKWKKAITKVKMMNALGKSPTATQTFRRHRESVRLNAEETISFHSSVMQVSQHATKLEEIASIL